MSFQVHILTANGSVTDTRNGRTLGHLIAVNHEVSGMTVFKDGVVHEYYIWSVDDAQVHGIVALVSPVVTNKCSQIVTDWLKDLAVVEETP